MRLHVPASASQPALIGNITIAAAAGSSVAAVPSQTPTPTVPVKYLELDAGGKILERVLMAEGGDPVADLVEGFGSSGVQMQPGTVHYADIVARVAPGAFSPIIGQWLQGIATPVTGRMIGVDYAQKPQYQRSFSNAQITEIAFPALDAASNDSGYLELRLSPPSTHLEVPPSGTQSVLPTGKGKSSAWLVRDFSLSSQGLDTKHVERIEPFHVVMKKTTGSHGGSYIAGTRLTVTLGSSSAASWVAWQEDFLVKTKGSPERTLTLEFLDGSGNKLLKLEGNGVGLLSLRPVGQDASSQSLTRYKAELYVERWKILP
jgi:hypothetical protein